MQPRHQLKIADLYNIPIGNVKKLVPHFFDKEKYVIPYKILLENSKYKIDVKLVNNEKDFSQCTSKSSYIVLISLDQNVSNLFVNNMNFAKILEQLGT